MAPTVRTSAGSTADSCTPTPTASTDTGHTHADTTKAQAPRLQSQELLNAQPEHTIREGIQTFAEWDDQNREWDEPS